MGGLWPTQEQPEYPPSTLMPFLAYLSGVPEVTSPDNALAHFTNATQDPNYYPYNVKAYLERAIDSGSPYAGAVAYDPSIDIGEAERRYRKYDRAIQETPTTQEMYNEFVKIVLDRADDVLADDDTVEEQVAGFEDRAREELDKTLNEFMGGMRDIGAVNGSAFKMGQAVIFKGYQRNVADFRTKATLAKHQLRFTLVSNGLGNMMQIFGGRLQAEHDCAQMCLDIKKLNMIAMGEYYQKEQELGRLDATYELDLLMNYGMRSAAPINAGAQMPGPKPIQTALGVAGQATGIVAPFVQAGVSLLSSGISSLAGLLPLVFMFA